MVWTVTFSSEIILCLAVKSISSSHIELYFHLILPGLYQINRTIPNKLDILLCIHCSEYFSIFHHLSIFSAEINYKTKSIKD